MNTSTWASWRTALSGGLTALGTALSGIGTVTMLSNAGQAPSNVVLYTTLAGFFVSALGAFFNGMVGRDDAVSSEAAGANAKPGGGA